MMVWPQLPSFSFLGYHLGATLQSCPEELWGESPCQGSQLEQGCLHPTGPPVFVLTASLAWGSPTPPALLSESNGLKSEECLQVWREQWTSGL